MELTQKPACIHNPKEFTITDFVGLVINTIEKDDRDDYIFTTSTKKIKMFHDQDCCEKVDVYSVENLDCLLNSQILESSEFYDDASYDEATEKDADVFWWTFYTFVTEKGVAKITWFGSSNGYYDMGVQLKYVENNQCFCEKNKYVEF